MQVEIKGKPSFCHLLVALAPGETIVAEDDAMASMDSRISHSIRLRGGVLTALLRRILGDESFFFNIYKNETSQSREIVLTQPTPGYMEELTIDGNELFFQPGAFVACTEGVKLSLSWAGFKSWFAKEGLFRLRVHGKGKLWYGCYGAIYPYDLDGEFIVDTSHLVAYPNGVNLHIQLSGRGAFSSYFSGEGFVTRLRGKGTIYLQSRSITGLAAWLNQRLV